VEFPSVCVDRTGYGTRTSGGRLNTHKMVQVPGRPGLCRAQQESLPSPPEVASRAAEPLWLQPNHLIEVAERYGPGWTGGDPTKVCKAGRWIGDRGQPGVDHRIGRVRGAIR